jgi:SOS response regulatory protein OraA/RecX
MNAYEKAIQLLKIRPHHSAELGRKLLLRKFSEEAVNEALNRLAQENLLNDNQFLETFLDNLIRYKNFGFFMLKAKLIQRGASGTEAEAMLRENFPLETEIQTGQRIVERYKSLDRLKLAQKLSSRGFRTEAIRQLTTTSFLAD